MPQLRTVKDGEGEQSDNGAQLSMEINLTLSSSHTRVYQSNAPLFREEINIDLIVSGHPAGRGIDTKTIIYGV